MNAVTTFPAPRVTPNARHAFGGVWRLTVRRYRSLGYWLMLLGLLAMLFLFAMAQRHLPLQDAPPARYVGWMAMFYVCFLVPMLAFIAAGGVMRDDLQADAIDYLFTRPVRRPAFVVFRYLSHLACAQVDFLLGLIVLFAVGAARGVPDIWEALPRLWLAQVLVITAFSAFGFLCAMITSRYVIIGLVYGALIEVGVGNVPTQISRISMILQAQAVLRPVLIGAAEGDAPTAIRAAAVSTPAAVTTLLGFAVVMLFATAAIFIFKEFAGTSREN